VDRILATRSLIGLLVPPRCAICARATSASDLVCEACALAIETAPSGAGVVAGVGPVTWSAPYGGEARDLVAALKFRASLPLAGIVGRSIAAALPPGLDRPTVVAAPPAPWRYRRRGFDPAELIAAEVAASLGLARAAALRRSNGPRQVGRARSERLGSPPRVWASRRAPASVLLVDDVLTTGATLAACAQALRAAGSTDVRAAVFARALGETGRGA
jgi:predicted amidophosphoribosyltransferase